MFKQSSSRNLRTKGIRVKHVLQICLLLGVCFWLIYQIKHSHDKKKEFDENDAKISGKLQSRDEILKFGRKELHPRIEKVTTRNEKNEEEDEEEEAGREEGHLQDKIATVENKNRKEEKEEETEEEEEELHSQVEEVTIKNEKQDEEEGKTGGEEGGNKHDEEEQEEEEDNENRHEEKEQEEEESKNGETEAGDDEVDDQEKTDGEADHDEEFVDEEKEREEVGDENESEDKEGQVENNDSAEDQDHDEGGRNTHEAREEHYKGDDASSAVAHDTQFITTDTENLSSEQESKSNNTRDINGDQNNSGVKVGEGLVAENDARNMTASEETVNNSSSSYKPEDSFHPNSTMTTESNEQLRASNNSTEVSTDGSNNSTRENTELDLGPLQNVTQTLSESIKLQNATDDSNTGEGTTRQTIELKHANNDTTSGSNQSDSNSTLSSQIEEVYGLNGEFTKSNRSESPVLENIISSNATAEAENRSEPSTKEDIDATQNEKLETNKESGETDESSGSSDENADGVQLDPVDSSDSSMQSDVENRIDLDVLPEFKTEGDGNDDAMAE